MTQKLILLRGIPGSGKSTLASWLSLLDNVTSIEADDFFVDDGGVYRFDPTKLWQAHNWCQKMTRISIEMGYNVIISNTSTTEKEVAVYQQIAEEFGVDFVSLVVENRHGGTNVHNVPEDKLQAMKQRFSVKL